MQTTSIGIRLFGARLGEHFGAYAATLALVLLASSSPAVTRFSLSHTLGPVDLVVLRCCIGGLLFLPILLAGWRRISGHLLAVGFVLAFLHGWGMHLTAVAGLQFAPAGHAAALGPGFVAVWVMLWRRLWHGAWPSAHEAVGLGLIGLGALLLVAYASWSFYENKMLAGDLLFLLSSALAAVYLVYVQGRSLDPLQAAALVAVYSGFAGGVLLYFWPQPSALWTAPAGELLLQAVFQGVGMGACSVLFASYAALRLGSQRFAVFVAAIPVLSLVFGWFIVGDGVHGMEAAAIALVSAGIVVAAWMRGRSPRPANSYSPSPGPASEVMLSNMRNDR